MQNVEIYLTKEQLHMYYTINMLHHCCNNALNKSFVSTYIGHIQMFNLHKIKIRNSKIEWVQFTLLVSFISLTILLSSDLFIELGSKPFPCCRNLSLIPKLAIIKKETVYVSLPIFNFLLRLNVELLFFVCMIYCVNLCKVTLCVKV